MQTGKRRAMWDQICFTVSPHLPKGTNPYALNPYRKAQSRSAGPPLDVHELHRWREELAHR